jgi:uncharacterized protein YndB with AHSA1/START domain
MAHQEDAAAGLFDCIHFSSVSDIYATKRLHLNRAWPTMRIKEDDLMTDRIEKQIQLKAPVSRVWRALTNHEEFGEWFRVKLEQPFAPGQPSTGHITHPGYEHIRWNAMVKEVVPETLFSFTWHPYAIDPAVDYSGEPQTLIEFRLKPVDGGTLLTMTESGFDSIPEHRRAEAFRMNDGGWTQQMQNIADYVAAHP